MKIKSIIASLLIGSCVFKANSQTGGLTNTTQRQYSKMHSVNLQDGGWTKGFWAERFKVCRDTMLLNMRRIFDNPELSQAYRNCEIEAE